MARFKVKGRLRLDGDLYYEDDVFELPPDRAEMVNQLLKCGAIETVGDGAALMQIARLDRPELIALAEQEAVAFPRWASAAELAELIAVKREHPEVRVIDMFRVGTGPASSSWSD